MPTTEEERRRKLRAYLSNRLPDEPPKRIEARIDLIMESSGVREEETLRPPPRGLPQRPEEEGGSPFVRFLKGQLGDSWEAITDTLGPVIGPPMQYMEREIGEPFGTGVAVSLPNLLRRKTSWREQIPFTRASDARVEREQEQYSKFNPAVKFAAESPLGFLGGGSVAGAKFGLEAAAAGLGAKGALPWLLRSGAQALGPIASVEAVPGAVLGAAARGAGRALRPSQTAARAAGRGDQARVTWDRRVGSIPGGGAPSYDEQLIGIGKQVNDAAPKYQNRSLKFDNDIDKALYVVAQSKQGTARSERFITWLEKQGIPEAELKAAKKGVTEHVQVTVSRLWRGFERRGPVTIPTSRVVRKLTAAAPTAPAPTFIGEAFTDTAVPPTTRVSRVSRTLASEEQVADINLYVVRFANEMRKEGRTYAPDEVVQLANDLGPAIAKLAEWEPSTYASEAVVRQINEVQQAINKLNRVGLGISAEQVKDINLGVPLQRLADELERRGYTLPAEKVERVNLLSGNLVDPTSRFTPEQQAHIRQARLTLQEPRPLDEPLGGQRREGGLTPEQQEHIRQARLTLQQPRPLDVPDVPPGGQTAEQPSGPLGESAAWVTFGPEERAKLRASVQMLGREGRLTPEEEAEYLDAIQAVREPRDVPPGGQTVEEPSGLLGEAAAKDATREQAEAELISQSAGGVGGQPPRKSGHAVGDSATTPPPRTPEKALADDLEIPTHEKIVNALLRKHEAARNMVRLELKKFISGGEARLSLLGTARQFSERSRDLENIFKELHGEMPGGSSYRQVPNNLKVPAGERLSPELRTIVAETRELRDLEQQDMLRFLQQAREEGFEDLVSLDIDNFASRMMAHPDYFPRGWKQPKRVAGVMGSRGYGRPPQAVKHRLLDETGRPVTFSEMLESGWEPVSWNPYQQMALRRIAGVEYREQIILANRLRQVGKLLPVAEAESRELKWLVPDIGPVFRGRPIPDSTVKGGATTTPSLAVPPDVAKFLESFYGKTPTLHVGDTNIEPVIRHATNFFKGAKLSASLFQHVDIFTRAVGSAWTPTGVWRGAPLKALTLPGRLLNVTFRPSQRGATTERLLSTTPIMKERGVSNKMLVEEGLNVQTDTSVFIGEAFTDNFLKPLEAQAGTLPGRVTQRIKKANEFWQEGLFGPYYQENMLFAIENFILPAVHRSHRGWTDRQVAAEVAKISNVMFSSLGRWQTIFKDPSVRRMLQTIFFSTNEQESLIRASFGTLVGPSKLIWTEYWAGLFVSMVAVANTINYAATGSFLPKEAYSPVRINDPYAPFFGVGYNSRFLSPEIPFFKGRDGVPVYLDIVGQMDTAFRWLSDPVAAFGARVNVMPRAIVNQVEGETFYNEKLESLTRRVGQGTLDLVAPISATAGIGALQQQIPGAERFIPEQESRLGGVEALQAVGINLRAQGTGELLDEGARKIYRQSYDSLEPYQKDRVRVSNADELATRTETGARRGDRVSETFFRVNELDAERLKNLKELPTLFRGSRDRFRKTRQLYYDIEDNFRARRSENFEGLDFEPSSDPVLAQYYALFEKSGVRTEGGNFLSAEFTGAFNRLMSRLSAVDRNKILRNMFRREIPPEVFPFLPDSFRRRYIMSVRARQAHDKKVAR